MIGTRHHLAIPIATAQFSLKKRIIVRRLHTEKKTLSLASKGNPLRPIEGDILICPLPRAFPPFRGGQTYLEQVFQTPKPLLYFDAIARTTFFTQTHVSQRFLACTRVMNSSSSFAVIDQFLAELESRIQEAIASTPTEPTPTIRCRFQQGRLLVLSEDAETADTSAERDRRFKSLAVAMGSALTAINLPEGVLDDTGELPVRLYLRQRGIASPYAARSWGWRPSDAVVELFDAGQEEDVSSDDFLEAEGRSGALVLVSNQSETSQAEGDPAPPPTPDQRSLLQIWQRFKAGTDPNHLKRTWHGLTGDWHELPWRSAIGLTVAGVLVGAIAYGITRPCTFGSCVRRQTASDLSQDTLNRLKGSPTPDEVRSAHENLEQAIRLVSAIPPWSPHYDAAQAELLRYRTQLSDLGWIIAAQQNATEASEKSQDPPHPVPTWVETHLLWQKAVNHLNRVPEDSPLAAFASRKLKEYENNYEVIGNRLAIEEQAEANLNKATQAAEVANAQTESAATLTDWLVAQREWDAAIQALDKIPKGTLAYDEARSLLSEFRSKSVQTRTRVTFEQAGERAYQEALADAAQAQAAEKANQWTQAVNHWSEAFAQMRQVPKNTIRYSDAQGHLDSYQTSLKQAQNRLKQAVALQSLESDLEELCPIAQGICTFNYGPQQIELMLREPYDSAVRQSISPPSTQGRLTRSNSVIEETHQLVQSIMQLGNQVQMPIVLYSENRQFIARYKPEYGGFVKN